MFVKPRKPLGVMTTEELDEYRRAQQNEDIAIRELLRGIARHALTILVVCVIALAAYPPWAILLKTQSDTLALSPLGHRLGWPAFTHTEYGSFATIDWTRLVAEFGTLVAIMALFVALNIRDELRTLQVLAERREPGSVGPGS